MDKPSFQFNREQITRLFPYYILVDADMIVVDVGIELTKQFKKAIGKPFPALFAVSGPFHPEMSSDFLRSICGHPVVVTGTESQSAIFEGQFEYFEPREQFLFIGLPANTKKATGPGQLPELNERKYRSIIANMRLGLLEIDQNEIVTYANSSFCKMSGYTLRDVIGRKAIKLLAKGEAVDFLKEKKQSHRKGVPDAYQFEFIDSEGQSKWWLISGGPRYNNDNKTTGSIGIFLDITDQKKLETELIEARGRAELLAATNGAFLANMSHEIRTPLNGIIGMGNHLAKTNLTGQQQFYLDTINSAADNLLVILNDILDLSKIGAGKLSLENIGFESKTIAHRAMQVLAHKAEEKGIKLFTSYFDKNIAPILIGDPYRLNQVLLNLISNAIKFTEKGNVDISFKLLQDSATWQIVLVTVHDTGIGMEESFIKTLFDKFSQENKAITRTYGGTGLGMSICKELISLMNGEIAVESKKDVGTNISFTLRLMKGTADQLPAKNNVTGYVNLLAGKKILVVDDNEMNRLVVSIFLKNYGAEVTEAVNGQMAITVLGRQNADLVLMDLLMPGINGFEATQIIRNRGNMVPVIALSANANKGEMDHCTVVGMNDYVTKPFKEEELLTKIALWLKIEINVLKNGNEKVLHRSGHLYDLTSLKSMSMGNEVFVRRMLTIFCEETPNIIKDMLNAHMDNDLKRLGALAHKIKPSIDNLNIEPLKSVIRDVEKMANTGIDSQKLSVDLSEIERTVAKVIMTMKRDNLI